MRDEEYLYSVKTILKLCKKHSIQYPASCNSTHWKLQPTFVDPDDFVGGEKDALHCAFKPFRNTHELSPCWILSEYYDRYISLAHNEFYNNNTPYWQLNDKFVIDFVDSKLKNEFHRELKNCPF